MRVFIQLIKFIRNKCSENYPRNTFSHLTEFTARIVNKFSGCLLYIHIVNLATMDVKIVSFLKQRKITNEFKNMESRLDVFGRPIIYIVLYYTERIYKEKCFLYKLEVGTRYHQQ